MEISCIAVGGSLGALTRASVGRLLPFKFPVATLLVNIVGSFLIGWLPGFREALGEYGFLLATTGFCGALTTMSTFILETAILMRVQAYKTAMLNIGLTLTLALTAFSFAYSLSVT